MSVFPPGDPRNDNSPSGIRWESNPADTAEIERLKQALAELQACKDRYEKCFVRIAKSYGITTPLILVGMAKDNDENYAEILTRFVEEQRAGVTKGGHGA